MPGLTLDELAKTIAALKREAARPAPTLYVVEERTPDGAIYQMGKVALGPAKHADALAAEGLEVLYGHESAEVRVETLRRHGWLAFADAPLAPPVPDFVLTLPRFGV